MATPAEQKDYKLPGVVIVGRANVGKSSLFNRLLEEKKAMVSDVAGTTRTNNEGDVLWRGTYIHVIDTGGPDNAENEPFAKDIIAQSKAALAQADVILLVGDAESGILPQERELARESQTSVITNVWRQTPATMSGLALVWVHHYALRPAMAVESATY